MATFSPTSAFVSVDLPTLGLPIMDIMAVFVIIFSYRFFRLISCYPHFSERRLFAASHKLFLFALVHMIIAEKMEHRMNCEIRYFALQRMSVFVCLLFCALPRDHYISERQSARLYIQIADAVRKLSSFYILQRK